MRKLTALIAIMLSCQNEAVVFQGIPVNHQCSQFEDRVAICVSDEHEYTCIAESSQGCGSEAAGRVMCAPSGPKTVARLRGRRERQRERDDDTSNDLMLLMMLNNNSSY